MDSSDRLGRSAGGAGGAGVRGRRLANPGHPPLNQLCKGFRDWAGTGTVGLCHFRQLPLAVSPLFVFVYFANRFKAESANFVSV